MKTWVLAVLAVLPAVFAALPAGWKTCKENAGNYDACLTKEVNFALSTLIDGNKKLGVLPMDPLRIQKVEIPKNDGPVSIQLSFKDIDVTGIRDLKYQSIKSNWKHTKASAHVPVLRIIGKYNIDGKALVLPIKGDGKCNITFEEMDIDVEIDWKDINQGGKKYFQIKNLDLNLKPKKFVMQFDNLFNGDKTLGESTNKFLNENWQDILKELKPPIGEAISEILTQIANRILSKIPAEEIDLK